MVTYIINGGLILWVIADSLKQKQYRYTAAAVMIVFYFVFDILQKRSLLSAFGWIQKTVLIILAVYMFAGLVKSSDWKRELPMAVFAAVSCGCRFLKSAIFTRYKEILEVQVPDSYSIEQVYHRYYALADGVTKLMLILILFCMTMQLENNRECNR